MSIKASSSVCANRYAVDAGVDGVTLAKWHARGPTPAQSKLAVWCSWRREDAGAHARRGPYESKLEKDSLLQRIKGYISLVHKSTQISAVIPSHWSRPRQASSGLNTNGATNKHQDKSNRLAESRGPKAAAPHRKPSPSSLPPYVLLCSPLEAAFRKEKGKQVSTSPKVASAGMEGLGGVPFSTSGFLCCEGFGPVFRTPWDQRSRPHGKEGSLRPSFANSCSAVVHGGCLFSPAPPKVAFKPSHTHPIRLLQSRVGRQPYSWRG